MKSTPFGIKQQLVGLDNNDFPQEEDQASEEDLSSQESASDEKNIVGRTRILPGHPRVPLNNGPILSNFLLDELYASDLEAMAPHLWIMSTQSHVNINPLHRQKVHGRNLIISEDPRLHLCWIYDRIFIKPLPRYLLSHSFWEQYLVSDDSSLGSQRRLLCKAAVGFLRTYSCLIRHESDFSIAKHSKLIPPHTTWEQFCNFISAFECIPDDQVSQRYHYGELRLSRLNFYVKILLRKFQYVQLNRQYGAYFGYFFGPLLFVFAVLSCTLNAMQVWLQVEGLGGQTVEQRFFSVVCQKFSSFAMVFAACLSSFMATLLAWMIADEWVFALKDRRRRARAQEKTTRNA